MIHPHKAPRQILVDGRRGMRVHLEKILLDANESFRLLQWEENVRDAQIVHADGTLEPISGAGETWHLHHQLELVLVTHGTGTCFIGDHIGTFDAPLLYLVGSNLPHRWRNLKPTGGYVLQFTLSTEHGLWKLPESEPIRELCVRALRGICFPSRVLPFITEKFTQMLSCNPICRLAYFLEILGVLVEVPEDESILLSEKEFSLSSTSIHHQAIDRVIRYMIDHHAEEISLDDVLKVSHMSKPTFSRQFKRHTGKTFVDFLNEVRLDEVRRALLETEESISRIALQAGFGNLSHFNRLFRRHFGISPSEFRRKRV